jgi:hypothetical protein
MPIVMAGAKLNPDMETANDAEWLRTSERASALSGLLTRRSPAAVEEVARDLKLQSGHGLQAVGPLSQESFPGLREAVDFYW